MRENYSLEEKCGLTFSSDKSWYVQRVRRESWELPREAVGRGKFCFGSFMALSNENILQARITKALSI